MSLASRDRDVWDDELGRRRCTANAKSTGDRCRKRPIPGGRVCKTHGGGAPQVQRSARQRLLAAVDPAIGVLIDVVETEIRVLTDQDGRPYEVGPGHADRIRAAEAILDRTGYPRRAELSMVDGVAELEALLDELEDDDDD